MLQRDEEEEEVKASAMPAIHSTVVDASVPTPPQLRPSPPMLTRPSSAKHESGPTPTRVRIRFF